MPNDLYNIKKIYPDSKVAFKFFRYAEKLRRNVESRIPINTTPNLPEWFQFADGVLPEGDELRVIAMGSEYFSNGKTENLGLAKAQKFLSTISDYKNVEATWYLKFQSGTDPWCIFARSTGRRTSKRPCAGTSYRAYLKPNGQVRLAKESIFANLDTTDWKQAISALDVDQIVGMKFICFNINDDTAVRVELWLDELNSNDWKLADAFTDMGNNWGSGLTKCGCSNDQEAMTWGGPIVGFSCEGQSASSTNYSFSNVTVREINAGGQFAEARAGDTVAIAGGGRAFASAGGTVAEADTGGGVSATAGTGSVNINEPQFTVQNNGSTMTGSNLPFPFNPQSGTSGTTTSPVSSPSTGTPAIPTTGSNQAPEKPLVTVYRDLGLMYNIVLDHESACDIGSPFAIDYRQIYSTGGVDTQEIKMFNSSGGTIRAGVKARSSLSVIVNKVIKKVTVALRKFGNPTTGFVGMEIRDKNGNLMATFPNTIDPAVISLGAFGPTYTFTYDANTHKCQTGDMLLVTYANGSDTDANNCIILKSTDKDEIDGFDSVEVKQAFGSTTYPINEEKDFVAAIFI